MHSRSRRRFLHQAALGSALAFPAVRRSLAANDLDSAKTRFVLGPSLKLDAVSGEIIGITGGDAALLARARDLARGTHRPPYNFTATG